MADLNTKTFIQIVQTQVAAIQARSAGLLDFAVGAILRAITEAVAGVVLWLQGLILAVLAMTRLSTSEGADADSFVADFGGPIVTGGQATFARLPSAASVGEVTFFRFTTTGSAQVAVGSTVETTDGSQRFMVVADVLNSAYDPAFLAYVMGPGVGDVTVPVVAVAAGAAGNVLAGAVTVITSAIPGVDTVSNAEPFVGGQNAESTADMRVRWRAYILSLREATPAAVLYHASTVQAGLKLLLVENVTRAGSPRRGFFYVMVDDGTGTPPASLIQAVAANVDIHRAAGVEFAVYAPDVVVANIVAGVNLRDGLSVAEEVQALTDVDKALTDFVSALPLGGDIVYSQLYQVAYNASPDVIKVASLTLNGGTADLVVGLDKIIKPGTVTVN